MLLVCLSFPCVMGHGITLCLAGFVPKLVPNFLRIGELSFERPEDVPNASMIRLSQVRSWPFRHRSGVREGSDNGSPRNSHPGQCGKQQRSTIKTCLDNFMFTANSPVLN